MIDILFMGRKPVAARVLSWLLLQPAVRVKGVITDSHLAVSPTADVARLAGVPLLDRSSVENGISSGTLDVDLGISVLYWQKIRQPLIGACRLGVVNFHPAPLPDYKGTAGYNLAILEGRSSWAVSAHYVDENIDTGDIIEVRDFKIDPENETAKSLEAVSQKALKALCESVCSRLLASNSRLPAVRNVGGRYISRAEMEAMKEVRDGDDVSRKIRAFWFPPYDGAYRVINGVKCTLVDRAILNSLADPDSSNLFTPASSD